MLRLSRDNSGDPMRAEDGGDTKAARARAQAPRKGRRPAYAAIDLGTNNCRLLVAQPTQGGGFRVVDSFSRIVRLGEGVATSGALSEDAMARTVAALKIIARRLRRHGAVPLRAIATEACRRAKNADALVARVQAEAGIALEIVSEAEEARLAAVGCAPLVGCDYDGALVFDIGGGSTEIIWLRRNGRMIETVFAASLPLGVVVLSETGRDYDAMLREASAAVADLARAMEVQAGPFAVDTHHLLGTSGTVTTLAGVALKLPRYDRRRIDASWHDRGALTDVARGLTTLSVAERAKMPCVGPSRADLMPAGCAVFEAIQAQWPCAKLRVADRGLREGILRELMERS
ncbi:MAG TPA: Ppx/GppA phosphatase family protein [Rhizomicrobium sp.]|nr:Ppx/GppA phosphatase family protein [Rhizomicrobium sp.]